MPEPKENAQRQPPSSQPEDIPMKAAPADDAVKGGMLKRGNDEDDDLEDLEIQR